MMGCVGCMTEAVFAHFFFFTKRKLPVLKEKKY